MLISDQMEFSEAAYFQVKEHLASAREELRQQIDLARELEQIADALPDRFDQHRCRELAEHIPAVFDVTLTVTDDKPIS